jgi:hypothetical protein
MQLNKAAKQTSNDRFMFYGLRITGKQNLDSSNCLNDMMPEENLPRFDAYDQKKYPQGAMTAYHSLPRSTPNPM